MKTHLRLLFGVVGLGTFGLVAVPGAAGRGLQMLVVAEQTDPKSAVEPPKTDHPADYVAFDAGYVEAGDPIANEKPPASSTIAEALRHTLAEQGYQPAAAGHPQILFVYHWGLLNRDSHAIRNGATIDPNLHARLALLTTTKQDGEIENYLLDQRQLGRANPAFRIPGFLSIQDRDLLHLTNDDSYFIVLSAYDYASVSHREAKLLWRVKMSTRSAGVSMADALPTLLQGGAPLFGRNLDRLQYIKAPLLTGNLADSTGAGTQGFSPPSGAVGPLDENFLRDLMKREHAEFSGTRLGDLAPYAPRLSTSTL